MTKTNVTRLAKVSDEALKWLKDMTIVNKGDVSKQIDHALFIVIAATDFVTKHRITNNFYQHIERSAVLQQIAKDLGVEEILDPVKIQTPPK